MRNRIQVSSFRWNQKVLARRQALAMKGFGANLEVGFFRCPTLNIRMPDFVRHTLEITLMGNVYQKNYGKIHLF